MTIKDESITCSKHLEQNRLLMQRLKQELEIIKMVNDLVEVQRRDRDTLLVENDAER